jgi:hypothetical protein
MNKHELRLNEIRLKLARAEKHLGEVLSALDGVRGPNAVTVYIHPLQRSFAAIDIPPPD